MLELSRNDKCAFWFDMLAIIKQEKIDQFAQMSAPKVGRKRYLLHGEYEGLYLTKRELDVIKLVMEGHSIKNVCNMLDLSLRTVEDYLAALRKKLGFSTTKKMYCSLREKDYSFELESEQVFS